MKNQKGFTLIEIIAVVVLLGIMGMIAILGISNYIDKSKRKLYINTAREYIQICANMLSKNDLIARDTNTTYYYNIENLETDNGAVKDSPYGKWVEAYVVVVINNKKEFKYYWVSVDETGHKIDLTAEKDLSIGKIYVTDDKTINNSFPIGGRDNIVIVEEEGNKEKTEPTVNITLEQGQDCYEWEENEDETITITNYNTSCGLDVDIPSKIGNLKVTRIGNRAFKGKGITSVRSYDGIVTIGYAAFQGNNLKSVKLSKSVKTIEDFGFYNSKIQQLILPEGLEKIGSYGFASNKICNVTLPASLKSIGSYAFQGNCLSDIDINSNATIGGAAFSNNNFTDANAFIYKTKSNGSKDFTTIVGYGGETRENIVIPEWKNGYQLKTIDSSAFQSAGLKGSVTIPDSVETINSSAFYSNSLTSVKLPANLKTIGSTAFRGNQLSSIDIPDTVTSIGGGAFVQNKMDGIDGIFYKRIADPDNPGKGKWDYTTIVSYGGGRVANYALTIPAKKEGVTLTKISGAAFLSCNIKTLNLPPISDVPNLTIDTNTFYHNVITNNSEYIHNGFMFKVTNGTILYNEISDFVGPNPGTTGTLVIPETAPDGTKITKLSGTYTWRTYGTVSIPKYVTSMNNGIFAKTATNDPYLVKIINNTGKEWNWTSFTGAQIANQKFKTGTIEHQAGNIEVVDH